MGRSTCCLCLLLAPLDVAFATEQQKCISRVALQQGPTEVFMFPQLVPMPWSQSHHPITAGSKVGIFSIGAASRDGIWKQAHSGTDLFQQGNYCDSWDDPCHAPVSTSPGYWVFLVQPAGMQHVQLDPDGREGEGGGGCCCVVLPAVGRVASMAGSSHLWEFPGCKLDLAGRAQQGSCRGWAG